MGDTEIVTEKKCDDVYLGPEGDFKTENQCRDVEYVKTPLDKLGIALGTVSLMGVAGFAGGLIGQCCSSNGDREGSVTEEQASSPGEEDQSTSCDYATTATPARIQVKA